MLYPQNYDVIVVGGGHAGTEAALAAARMGKATLLLSHSLETIGQMSCNPAIGGIGKGHLVCEIDALGGLMGRAADLGGIQFRTINASKGPAVQATRVQADRIRYKAAVRKAIENQANLDFFQQAVDDLILVGDQVRGVVTQMGLRFQAPTVILTVGTFLGGRIHIGLTQYSGGRAGEPPALVLAEKLRAVLPKVQRLKTGTPPRIDSRTIDYTVCLEQLGDRPAPAFSYLGHGKDEPTQISCYITRTNAKTHAVIRSGLERSPLYTGIIEGVGPRYCPSIEDKIVRFANREGHQIFLEPEGLDTNEVYPNGISTSLPFDIQLALVRTIPGLEHAHITRPGYAIEYDFADPQQLLPSLETRHIRGLFLAGQINGTTGYEEAGAQGLLAGINAVCYLRGDEPWVPQRDEAYLGVLVDDLISRGVNEPYRMFTSRAEYRLLLREDNADLRLTNHGRKLGLVGEQQWRSFNTRYNAIEQERKRLGELWVRPATLNAELTAAIYGTGPIRDAKAIELLARANVDYNLLMQVPNIGLETSHPEIGKQLEIQLHYAGYIERQKMEIARQRRNANTPVPVGLDYSKIHGLSNEVREILQRHQPVTVGQAARLSGVTPAAISLLIIYLKSSGQAPAPG
ncbi:tRNA uridine 5-carboxymethylaminomethyl modification protein [Achromatium sp. WMS2]|nr:tRNA uridine 5-carboxymethylaminomethyl modification protein [Achromatium sp. WMS2]